jgi:hypothetical protein
MVTSSPVPIGDWREKVNAILSYFCEAIRRYLNRRKMKQAAVAYREFLVRNPLEREQMETWEGAPLARSPRRTLK